MFRELINDAKSAAGSVIAKHAARATVAVPFIIALGFAAAGVTLMLVERYGHRNAYFMVAAGFCVIGVLAALFVRTKEHEEIVAEKTAEKIETVAVAAIAAEAASVEMPLALAGLLLSSPATTSSALSLARMLGRNLPLVVLLGTMGFLLWPKSDQSTDANAEAGQDQGPPLARPNGVDRSPQHHGNF